MTIKIELIDKSRETYHNVIQYGLDPQKGLNMLHEDPISKRRYRFKIHPEEIAKIQVE